jgi:hypothetical protein
MSKDSILGLLAAGAVIGLSVWSIKRRHDLRKTRALRASLRPQFANGSYLVKIIGGPAWAAGEYATFDAAKDLLLIEGEEFPAADFEFILT